MGAADEHRALNYLAVRYPAIYAKAAEEFGRNFSLTGVVARPSRLSGARKVVSAIFSYTHRETDVTEKYFVRVDTTEVFPFMVTKMAPYYDQVNKRKKEVKTNGLLLLLSSKREYRLQVKDLL